jgi:CO/xanthine dehydrogenase Mo-binding subunit
MTKQLHVIGKPANRVDALEKVLGTARYIDDYRVPGMLFGKVLRSNHPHSRIVRLDVSEALLVPGVKAVITSDDFVNHGRFGRHMNDQFVLAYQKVRYVGEGIAAVAAESPEAALLGMRAIHCELEPLPILSDPSRALDEDAPQVGPDRTDDTHPNFVVRDFVAKGDPEDTIKNYPVVLDRVYNTPHQDHAYLETEGALAIPSPDGSLIIYSTDQSPFINLGILTQTLGLPESKLRIIQPVIGGSFGGKNDLSYQTTGQVAALALKTGLPVKIVTSREESSIASYMRNSSAIHIRLGADSDGTLKACNVQGLLDSGASASGTYLTNLRAAMHAMGAYRYDNCYVDFKAVYTNNGFSGAFRGFGNPEACFAIEQAIDELADELGMDPIDFRLKNCLRLGDTLPHGQVLHESVGLVDCINKAREISGWDIKRKQYPLENADKSVKKGIGVAILFHGVSLGAEGADNASSTIEINRDYSVTLSSGLTDYGQGSRTVYTLIAAEELGVSPSRIQMYRPDTSTSIHSGPTVASRATVVGGNAVLRAASSLAQLLDFAAANYFNCKPDKLVKVPEKFIGPDEREVPWEKIVDHARSMGLILSARSRWDAPKLDWNFEKGHGEPYFAYHYGAQIAEVQVDLETGKTNVEKIWAVHDMGRVIFPQGAYGQLYGGIAQGLGYALMEECFYDNGYLQNRNFNEYLIPTSMDVPEVEPVFIETDNEIGPYGAKNIAEPGLVPTAPAILNAVAHAIGRRVYGLPADLEKVLLGHALRKPAKS